MMKKMKKSGKWVLHGKSLRQALNCPEGPESHRQFDMKQLLTEQDEDIIGEYLKKKLADWKGG